MGKNSRRLSYTAGQTELTVASNYVFTTLMNNKNKALLISFFLHYVWRCNSAGGRVNSGVAVVEGPGA